MLAVCPGPGDGDQWLGGWCWGRVEQVAPEALDLRCDRCFREPELSITTSASLRFVSSDSCRPSRRSKSSLVQPRAWRALEANLDGRVDKHDFVANFVPTRLEQQRHVQHDGPRGRMLPELFDLAGESPLRFSDGSVVPDISVLAAPRAWSRTRSWPPPVDPPGRRGPAPQDPTARRFAVLTSSRRRTLWAQSIGRDHGRALAAQGLGNETLAAGNPPGHRRSAELLSGMAAVSYARNFRDPQSSTVSVPRPAPSSSTPGNRPSCRPTSRSTFSGTSSVITPDISCDTSRASASTSSLGTSNTSSS